VIQDKETLDPFAKVSLLCGERKVKKKKTAVRKATTNPIWNEAMSFNIPASLLASSAIEVYITVDIFLSAQIANEKHLRQNQMKKINLYIIMSM